MKPSEQIEEIHKRLVGEFHKENPWFYTDNGYWPDFRCKAILEYLDQQSNAPESAWETEARIKSDCEGK